MKIDSINSFVFGLFSFAGLCLVDVKAEVSVPSPHHLGIGQIHSLVARTEQSGGELPSDELIEGESSDTANPSSRELWTGDEEQLLLRLRGEERSWDEIESLFPGRSASSLKGKYYRLTKDLSRQRKSIRPWTEEEDRILFKLAEIDATWEERAVYLPGRSAKAAKGRHRYLLQGASVAKNVQRRFTDDEDELLLALATTNLSWKDCERYFDDRSSGTLRARYSRLEKQLERPGKFTAMEYKELSEVLDLGFTLEEICEVLGKDEESVRKRIRLLEQIKQQDQELQNSKSRRYTDADYELMHEKYEQGMSWKAIAAAHFPGRTSESISVAYYSRRRQRQREQSEEEEK